MPFYYFKRDTTLEDDTEVTAGWNYLTSEQLAAIPGVSEELAEQKAKPSAQDAGGEGPGEVAWDDVTGKPSTFTPSAHNHAASDINSGSKTSAFISDFASAALTAAPAETATTAGALINAAGAATPNDGDLVATAEAAGLLKKITWTNVKAFLKTYFDTLYQVTLVSATNIKTINGDSVLGSGDLVVAGEGGVDTANSPNANEFARFTDSDTIEGRTVSEAKTDLGLENVTNESKATMFTSPALTGTPTAPTAAANTNTTQVATTAYVQTELADLINSAPGALDTLDELAAAMGDDANFAATTATALAGKQATLVSGTNIKTINGSTVLGSGDLVVSGSAVYPPGHIWGLTTSRPSTSTITIAAGSARDEGDTENMVLAAPITKSIASGWVVGDTNGGLNTGAEANSTWYEVILIKRTDTNVVDVMFSTTANRATLPANYTKQRRIGWVRNDGSGNILDFIQTDDHFTLVAPVNDVSTTSSATATSRTVTVPPNSRARLRVSCLGNTNINAGNAVVFSELTETDTAPTTSNGFNSIGSGDFAVIGAGHVELKVDGSSQIRDRSITATGTMAYDISTFGWIDHRRRYSAT